MKNIRTFIKEIGGPTSVASHLGTTPQNVVCWYQNGVPWKFRNNVAKMAENDDVTLPKGFWE